MSSRLVGCSSLPVDNFICPVDNSVDKYKKLSTALSTALAKLSTACRPSLPTLSRFNTLDCESIGAGSLWPPLYAYTLYSVYYEYLFILNFFMSLLVKYFPFSTETPCFWVYMFKKVKNFPIIYIVIVFTMAYYGIVPGGERKGSETGGKASERACRKKGRQASERAREDGLSRDG